MISKVLEIVILDKHRALLNTVDNQFGFKSKHSTDMCIFILKDIINYYIVHKSPIFCFFWTLGRPLIV